MSEEPHRGRSEPLLRAVFGAFELDVRAGELRKHGVKVRLQDQPFRVLLMLLERPGDVVLREEIRKKLWPNDTIVEFAPSINAAIQRLRDALGDSADQPRYVETVARRGYRFIGKLLPNGENQPELVHEAPHSPPDASIPDVHNLTGRTLAHYSVFEILGRGGMGEVYRARDTKLGRDVALKILPEEFAQDADRVARFEREAQVLGSLNNQHIAAIYGVEEANGIRALVMELVEGPMLAERIGGRAMSLDEALPIASQIAEALEAAHERGIVHRDLKPANVKLAAGDKVKVLDFGLAKALEPVTSSLSPDNSPTLTVSSGVILGTAAYMSPEQACGKTVDERADIWAFGVVLYEMLTGNHAFRGETVTDVLAAVVKEEPDLTRVPIKARRLLRTCLQKDPEQRLRAIADWRLLLEDAQVVRRSLGRTIALVVAAACLLVVASVFATRLWAPRTPSPSFQRVTYRRGIIYFGRFANGGQTILYSASWDGNPYRVYSTQEESPEFRDLGIANGHVLAVSRGGEMALALSPNFSFIGGTLARVPVSGGAPREIAEDISQADWTPDGARMAIVRAKAGLQQLEFPMGNVLYKSTGTIASPRISPHGDLIAFLDLPLTTSETLASVGSLATVDMQGHKKTLTGYWGGYISGLVWSGGDEILFAAAPFGVTGSLYAVNRSGRQRLVEHLPGFFSVLDVAPDGRVLLLRQAVSISLFYQRAGDSTAADLYWHDFSEIFDVSRDGNTILFAEGGDSDRSGEDYVSYIRHTDGSAAVRLGRGFPLALSPDGKWAMVLGSTEAPSQLVLLPTGVGEAREVTHDRIHHQGAAWTPDGKQIVFVGNEPGHGIRYYVQNLDGGVSKAITPENVAFNPVDPLAISPDGRFVAVSNLDGRVALQPLDGGAPRIVPKLEDGSEPLRWCPDGRSLMIYHFGDVPAKIVKVDVDTGKQTLWREVAPAYRSGLGNIREFRMGWDCQSYAYSATYAPSELWVASGLR